MFDEAPVMCYNIMFFFFFYKINTFFISKMRDNMNFILQTYKDLDDKQTDWQFLLMIWIALKQTWYYQSHESHDIMLIFMSDVGLGHYVHVDESMWVEKEGNCMVNH